MSLVRQRAVTLRGVGGRGRVPETPDLPAAAPLLAHRDWSPATGRPERFGGAPNTRIWVVSKAIASKATSTQIGGSRASRSSEGNAQRDEGVGLTALAGLGAGGSCEGRIQAGGSGLPS
jgi:hypothetical protein